MQKFGAWVEKQRKPGLVPKKITEQVHRGGKTFPHHRTVWVKPGEIPKGKDAKHFTDDANKHFQKMQDLLSKATADDITDDVEDFYDYLAKTENAGFVSKVEKSWMSMGSWQIGDDARYSVTLKAGLNFLMGKDDAAHRKQDFQMIQQLTGSQMTHSEYNELSDNAKKDAVGLLAFIAKTEVALRKRYPSGKATVYRGLHGDDIVKELKDEMEGSDGAVTIPHDGISSYTLDRLVAKDFAHPEGTMDDGVILKKEVPIEEILISFDDVWGADEVSGEREVLLNSDALTSFDSSELEFTTPRHRRRKEHWK
jgi:hypothetical protein